MTLNLALYRDMHNTASLPPLDEIMDAFAFLDDWEERYRYLIDLGRTLDPLPESARTEANRVRGCASQVWLETRSTLAEDGKIMIFRGDSDAHIVRGLVALVLSIYSGKSPETIAALNPAPIFKELGLESHLTPQRSNGLASMVVRIKTEAAQALA